MPKNNILRWVGSKTHAIDLVTSICEKNNINSIVEPFCGSSVLSIELNQKFNFKYSFCSDVDKYVISFFNHLKQNKEDIIQSYRIFHDLFSKEPEYYYEIRKMFNENHDPVLWYFLNRTCINGMMRYNKEKFNSPRHIGRNGTKPETIKKIFNEKYDAINKITFLVEDFHTLLHLFNFNVVEDNILWILDPPYYSTNGGLYFNGKLNENSFIDDIKFLLEKDQKIVLFYGSQFDDRTEIIQKILPIQYEIGKNKNPGSFFRKMSGDKTKVIEKVYSNV